MKLVSILTFLLFAGCITVPPPTSMTPATTAAVPSQPVVAKGSVERLDEAVKATNNFLKSCKERAKQGQVTTAIGFVRCWGEPARQAYQQSDLLIMDLVEKRLDVLYKAAIMYDNDEITGEQFTNVYNSLQKWFSQEVSKRFAGQLSAPSPSPSLSAPVTRYK